MRDGNTVLQIALQKEEGMVAGKHIENAKWTSEVWDRLDSSDRALLKKYFHLRPVSNGVTIVSTLPIAPMRGTHSTNAKDLERKLKYIIDGFKKITSVDKDKALKYLSHDKLGFKSRQGQRHLEENVQAILINSMERDKNLERSLGCEEPIQFVASEFIFEKGKNRIDVIGLSGRVLYFFELKKDRTENVSQLEKYIEYYTKHRNTLAELLFDYPINPAKSFDSIKGVMLMRHAENSIGRKIWREAKEKGIVILFYRQSLEFFPPQ